LREKVELPEDGKVERVERPKPTVPPEEYLTYDTDEAGIPAMADFGTPYRPRMISSTHDKAGRYAPGAEGRRFLNNRLRNKILSRLDEILMFEEMMLEDAEMAVFSYGICAGAAKAAVGEARARGIRAGLFRPITIWPFADEAVSRLAGRVKKILVVELNYGQLVREVQRVSRGKTEVTFLGDDVGQLIPPERILNEMMRSR
jgi:2-oxoglutarate ferredoxin oxidoreductase subunit alpha